MKTYFKKVKSKNLKLHKWKSIIKKIFHLFSFENIRSYGFLFTFNSHRTSEWMKLKSESIFQDPFPKKTSLTSIANRSSLSSARKSRQKRDKERRWIDAVPNKKKKKPYAYAIRRPAHAWKRKKGCLVYALLFNLIFNSVSFPLFTDWMGIKRTAFVKRVHVCVVVMIKICCTIRGVFVGFCFLGCFFGFVLPGRCSFRVCVSVIEQVRVLFRIVFVSFVFCFIKFSVHKIRMFLKILKL